MQRVKDLERNRELSGTHHTVSVGATIVSVTSESLRRSGREGKSTQREGYAYTASSHGVLIDMDTEEVPIEVSLGAQSARLFETYDDMWAASAVVGAPDLLEGHLVRWGCLWRAALARKLPLGDVAFLPDPKGWKRMLSHPRCEEFLQAVDAEVRKLTLMGAGEVVRGGRKRSRSGRSCDLLSCSRRSNLTIPGRSRNSKPGLLLMEAGSVTWMRSMPPP